MTNRMDPCADARGDFEAALQVFAYFLQGRSCIYVSAPITSGWRFVEWYKNRGKAIKDKTAYQVEHRKDVIGPNCRHAAEVISELTRRRAPTPIVDPTSFDVPGWTQNDYRCFWAKVIQRFVGEAIFLDGWEASAGCVCEFGVAVRVGIPILDEQHRPISVHASSVLIRRAVEVMTEAGLETNLFQSVLTNLESVKDGARSTGGA